MRSKPRNASPVCGALVVVLCAIGVGQRCGAETVPPAAPALAGWQKALAAADTGKSPLTVVCLGDSNTEIFGYAGPLRLLLQSGYGNRGFGYVTFGKRMEDLPWAPRVERKGTWQFLDVALDPKERMPDKPWMAVDGLWAESTDPAAEARAMVDVPSVIRVHYQKGPGLGRFRVSPIQGPGKPQEVSGTAEAPGYGIVEGEGLGCQINVIDGRVILLGLDARPTALAGGAVLHQIGNAWGMAHHFAAIEQAGYDAFFAAAKPGLITVLLGTNDMNNGWDGRGYAEQMRVLLGKLMKAAPGSSILVLSAPSCTFDRKSLSGAFDEAAKGIAAETGCAFWSLHDFVGENWRYWNHLGMMEWTLHYRPSSGMRVALEVLKAAGFDLYARDHQPALREPATLLSEGIVPDRRSPPLPPANP